MGDLGAAPPLEVLLQIGEEQVLQLSAVPADQMAVGGGVAVEAVRLSGNGEPPDLALVGQLVEVPVDRSHGDAGELLPGQQEDLLGIQMVVDIGKNVTDQGLLFGHPVTAFQIRNNSCSYNTTDSLNVKHFLRIILKNSQS